MPTVSHGQALNFIASPLNSAREPELGMGRCEGMSPCKTFSWQRCWPWQGKQPPESTHNTCQNEQEASTSTGVSLQSSAYLPCIAPGSLGARSLQSKLLQAVPAQAVHMALWENCSDQKQATEAPTAAGETACPRARGWTSGGCSAPDCRLPIATKGN